MRKNNFSIRSKESSLNVQGVPKKLTIGSPNPQFLSETFEIFVVGRLFIADLGFFSDLKNIHFKGPKSKFEIFKNS